MNSPENKTLSFTPDQARFVEHCITSGRYRSADEVVGAGLRLLADEEADRGASLEKVKQLIEVGARELDQGMVVAADEVFERLRRRRRRLRRSTRAEP